jgi:UDP:flavonoid glycosyltransferase YjiC (YdhE family)
MPLKVLVTTPGGLGHIHPMVPLAHALAARGHEVLWALPDRSVAQVEQAGLRATGVTSMPPVSPPEVVRQFPELRELSPAERPEHLFAKLFGALMAPPMLAGLIPVAQQWRPDLVVSDAAELAGPLVAAELGVPGVSKGFGPLLPEPRMARAAQEVVPLWQARALQARPYGGMYDRLYLDPYPPALPQPPAPHVPHRQLLRPVTYPGPTDAPVALPTTREDRPLVYLTMGTVFSDATVLRGLVAALAQLDVRLLVTVGPQGDPALLAEQPAHVRVERYVPQAALLRRCQLVVSHAGSGTVLSALELGLPQLCLPQGADQFLNAASVTSAGAGLSLAPGEATADAVRDAAARLLEDGSFGQAASRIGRSIAQMPSPDEVCAVLERLP